MCHSMFSGEKSNTYQMLVVSLSGSRWGDWGGRSPSPEHLRHPSERSAGWSVLPGPGSEQTCHLHPCDAWVCLSLPWKGHGQQNTGDYRSWQSPFKRKGEILDPNVGKTVTVALLPPIFVPLAGASPGDVAGADVPSPGGSVVLPAGATGRGIGVVGGPGTLSL